VLDSLGDLLALDGAELVELTLKFLEALTGKKDWLVKHGFRTSSAEWPGDSSGRCWPRTAPDRVAKGREYRGVAPV
jgi:hypothetical protein